MFEGIVFVLRTRIQWKALPKSYGAASSVHKYFQEWRDAGFFRTLWQQGVALYDEQKGSAGAGWPLMVRRSRLRWVKMVWAETRQTGGKNGTGRHLLVDEKGVPLGITLVGANRHDVSQLGAAKTVVENLCADAGCVGDKASAIIRNHGYIRRVRPRGEEIAAKRNKRFKPRRWIVEVSHGGFNNFRKLRVRHEKKTANALALHHLAATIALRRCQGKTHKNIIYG